MNSEQPYEDNSQSPPEDEQDADKVQQGED